MKSKEEILFQYFDRNSFDGCGKTQTWDKLVMAMEEYAAQFKAQPPQVTDDDAAASCLCEYEDAKELCPIHGTKNIASPNYDTSICGIKPMKPQPPQATDDELLEQASFFFHDPISIRIWIAGTKWMRDRLTKPQDK